MGETAKANLKPKYIGTTASNNCWYARSRVSDQYVDWLIDTGASVNVLDFETYKLLSAEGNLQLMDSRVPLRAADGNEIRVHGDIMVRAELGNETFEVSVTVAELGGQLQGILGMEFLSSQGFLIDITQGRLLRAQSHISLHRPEVGDEACSVSLKHEVEVPPRSEVLIEGKVSDNTWWAMHDTATLEPNRCELGDAGIMMPRALITVKADTILCSVTNFSEQKVTLRRGLAWGQLAPVENSINSINEKQDAEMTGPCKSTSEIPDFLAEMVETAKSNVDHEEFAEVCQLIARHKNAFAGPDDPLGRTNIVKHTIDTGDAKPIKQAARRMNEFQRKIADEEIDKMLAKDVIFPCESPWASPIVLVKKKGVNNWRFCIDFRKLNAVSKKDAYPLPNISDSLDALSGAQYFCTLDLASFYWQIEMDEKDKLKTAFNSHRGLMAFHTVPFGVCNGAASAQRLMETLLKGLQWERCLLYIDDVVCFGKSFRETLECLDQVLSRIEKAGLKFKPTKCFLFQKQVPFLGHVVSPEGISCDPDKIKAVVEWEAPTNLKALRAYLGFTSYYRRFINRYSEIAAPLNALTQKGVPYIWDERCEIAFETLKKHLTESPVLAYPSNIESEQFILDTDASNFGISGVLSQLQDGTERVIAYASKSLNKAQRNYCTTNKELLAVVTFVKHFRHYLLGRKFLIRTDHSSLKWLMNFKDAEGMVARWILQISSYDYEIEHRKGALHLNADGLSRKEHNKRKCKRESCPECSICSISDLPLCPVTRGSSRLRLQDEGESSNPTNANQNQSPACDDVQIPEIVSNWLECWDKDKIKHMQESDKDIAQLISFMNSNERPSRNTLLKSSEELRGLCAQWPKLRLLDGVVYRLWAPEDNGPEVYQLVAPREMRLRLFELVHAGPTGGHLGIKRTLAAIRQRVFWPYCKSDIKRWCAECNICAQIKPGPGFRARMRHVPYGSVGDRIGIDILGELPETENGNKYIVVICEYFTKWVVAVALPNQTAQTVADALMVHYISIFGIPRQIHSDQGTNFQSHLFAELSKLLGMSKSRTVPYRANSDGLVERWNRSVQQMLKAYVNENRDDWDDYLPYLTMAYRATVHETTGSTPNQMMFGRQLSMPIDVVMAPLPQSSGSCACPVEYVEWLRQTLLNVHEHARKRIKSSVARQKRGYDMHAKPTRYEVGQFVWRWYPPAAKRKLGKGWLGPYLIIACPTDIHCIIQKDPSSSSTRVHIDHLKPHLGRMPDIWEGRMPVDHSTTTTSEDGTNQTTGVLSDESDNINPETIETGAAGGEDVLSSPIPLRRSTRQRKPLVRIDL